MSRMARSDRTPSQDGEEVPADTWWIEAVVHWSAGVTFAVILGVFLTLATPVVPGFSALMMMVSDRGTDLAMRMRVAWGTNRTTLPPGVSSFAFIDIDQAACLSAGGGARCSDRSPADPFIVARIARAVLPAAPRVIVIDAALWDADPQQPLPHAEFIRLADEARLRGETPIIAVGPFRPDGTGNGSILEPGLAPPELAGGAVRFAPTFLYESPSQQDGVVRTYTPTSNVHPPPLPGGLTPTLPMLAALFIAARGDVKAISAIDCRFGAQLLEPLHSCARTPSMETLLTSSSVKDAMGMSDNRRLVFSFPSQAEGAAQLDRSGSYHRYLASQAVNADGRLLMAPELLKNAVVVISTSAPTALDWHDTPLGPMPGAEIIVNAIEALSTHTWVNRPTLTQRFSHEVATTFLASPFFLLFWLCFFFAESHLPASRWKPLAVQCIGLSAFLAAIAAAMWAAGVFTLFTIEHGVENGFAVEFFTPIFALSLEGFAEGAGWLLNRTESIMDLTVRRALRPLSGGHNRRR